MGPLAPVVAVLAILLIHGRTSPPQPFAQNGQQQQSQDQGQSGGVGGAGWSTTPLAAPPSFYAFQSSALTQTHTSTGSSSPALDTGGGSISPVQSTSTSASGFFTPGGPNIPYTGGTNTPVSGRPSITPAGPFYAGTRPGAQL